jgi:acetyl esterase/lipase
MVSKSTHVYKTVGSLQILLDIYTREADLSGKRYSVNTPVVLFFHGGGIVSHDRRLLPPHIPQSCLLRGWPLVSADYRLFPQANGLEVLEDVTDAYAFVREKLPGIFNIARGPMKNVIVAGSSAGMLLFILQKVDY